MASSKLKLTPCLVAFFEDEHKYMYGDIELSGVTSLLSRTIFKTKYKGAPDDVLKRAAERGSKIHKEVSMYILGGVMPTTVEAQNYVTKLHKTVKPIASEYLVSDYIGYASAIDIVGKGKKPNGVVLYDIKSNKSGIDEEYVMWQLSIYAHFIELMNPGVVVEGLNGIWLSEDNCEIRPVERIDKSIVEDLIMADTMGNEFVNPLSKPVVSETEDMVKYLSFEEEYVKLESRLKELDELKKKALESIEKTMSDNSIDSMETERLKFTMVAPTTKSVFDTKRFKSEHPDMASEYMKTSDVKGYLKVTVKK